MRRSRIDGMQVIFIDSRIHAGALRSNYCRMAALASWRSPVSFPVDFWYGRFQGPDRCRDGRHPHRRACVFLGHRSQSCAVVCPTSDGWPDRTGGSRPPDGCEQKGGMFRNIVQVLVNDHQSRPASGSKMATQRNLSCAVAMRTLCDGHVPRTPRICFRRWSARGPSCSVDASAAGRHAVLGGNVDQSTRMGLQAWRCNPCGLRKLDVSAEKAEIRDFCQVSVKLAKVSSGFRNDYGLESCQNTTKDMYLWRFLGLKLDRISVLQGKM